MNSLFQVALHLPTWQVLYVYLVVLPEQFKDCRDPNDPNNGTYPVWLQDAGEFEV